MIKKLLIIAIITSSLTVKAQNVFPPTGDVGIGDNSTILDHTHAYNVATFLDPKITVYQDSSKYLTENEGDYQIISSFGGFVSGNLVWENTYLYRDEAGQDWTKSRLHNGIAVGKYLSIPHENNYWQSTLTWWERDPKDDIQAWGNAGTTHMVLNQGNLGIGTTNPDSKLTVAGKIHSQEVKVTATAGGADFVFANNYILPKLKDVEIFIKKNKHLPEIAPAIEMEKNGIYLAEMNIKLLQKIEELTLYTIAQQKLLKKQEKEINELKTINKKQNDNNIKNENRLDRIEALLKK